MSLSEALAAAVPRARVSDRATDREAASRDLWPRRLIELRAGTGADTSPGVVVWPSNTEDVAAIVQFARTRGVPLVPFGAGSGVCGGISPSAESIVVDLKRLDKLELCPSEPVATAGAGLLGITLEERLGHRGLTAGHFPSSILCSTVGGWAVTRGAGQCSGKYGKIEDMVASLELVSGRGDVVTLGRRQGLDLTRLVIGSEGTLGIVTKVGLRTHAAPTTRAFSAFSFPDIALGWTALRRIFQSGLRPSVSRLYDPLDSLMLKKGPVEKGQSREDSRSPNVLRGLSKALSAGREQVEAALLRQALRVPTALYGALELGEKKWLSRAILVLVFEGQEEVEAEAEAARALCRECDGVALGEAPARAWFEHRYAVSYRQAPVFRAGAFSDTMEVAATWSRLGDLYTTVRAALSKHALVMSHLSHAYPDGCSIYFTFVGADRDDARALDKYDAAWRDALAAASQAGGTLSHHHGVGRSKAPRLSDELGAGVDVVRRLLGAWDPSGIMNPGNLLPPTTPSVARADLPARGAPGASAVGENEVDVISGLAGCDTTETLGALETRLHQTGHTLGLCPGWSPDVTVAAWLDSGMPWLRSPWEDPVDQRLAGYVGRFRNGLCFEVRPAPRRAVGPDLSAFFLGAGGAVGHIERAVLRAHASSARPARSLGQGPSESPLSAGERDLWRWACQSMLG